MRVGCTVLDDEAELRRFGYAQQLRRGMSAFGNFALSFSIISHPDRRACRSTATASGSAVRSR